MSDAFATATGLMLALAARKAARQHVEAVLCPRISVVFRCKLVLMIFGQYAFGDHVQDDQAFILRCRRLSQLAHHKGALDG
jgi:hypothetical protein